MQISRRQYIHRVSLYILAILFMLTIPLRKVRHMTAWGEKSRHGNKCGTVVRSRSRRQYVAVEPCPSYDPEETYRAIAKALEAIRFRPRRGLSVLLKPNIIGQNTPEQAVTTHPAVVDGVCRYFSELQCSIRIGDSSAFYQGGGTLEGMKSSGIAAVAARYGADLVPFETTRLRKMSSGRYLNPFYVTEAFFDHDLVVNLPKLKVHRLARYTGAIKNMYGCVVGGSKQLYHKQFQHHEDYQELWGKPLVDVYEAVTPHLSIMDAVIGLNKDGPAANGEPHHTGLIIASECGPALDVIACRVIGYDPMWVPAVSEAVARGLVDVDAVTVKGGLPSVPYVKLPSLAPSKGFMQKIDDYVFDQFMVTPVINTKKCTRCDACIAGCACGAIRRGRGRSRFPVIDHGACIRCYCCESYCPESAITLKGSAVNMLMRGIRQIIRL